MKSILLFAVLFASGAQAETDICGFKRGYTYCAKEISYEESTDANGFQRYILTGLYKNVDGQKFGVERNANKDTICNAIVGTFHSEHRDSIISISGVGSRWFRIHKDQLNCIVQWKD